VDVVLLGCAVQQRVEREREREREVHEWARRGEAEGGAKRETTTTATTGQQQTVRAENGGAPGRDEIR
jgi:hypothetical protein